MAPTTAAAPTREDFAAMLDEAFGQGNLQEGTVVKGTVVAIEKDMALIDVGAKTEAEVRARRHALGIRPVYKRVDTCAAEFATPTAYMYSTYAAPFAGTVATRTAEPGGENLTALFDRLSSAERNSRASAMPKYNTDVLSDKDVEDIVAFLASVGAK